MSEELEGEQCPNARSIVRNRPDCQGVLRWQGDEAETTHIMACPFCGWSWTD